MFLWGFALYRDINRALTAIEKKLFPLILRNLHAFRSAFRDRFRSRCAAGRGVVALVAFTSDSRISSSVNASSRFVTLVERKLSGRRLLNVNVPFTSES